MPSGGLNSPYVVGNTFSSDDTFKSTSNSPADKICNLIDDVIRLLEQNVSGFTSTKKKVAISFFNPPIQEES